MHITIQFAKKERSNVSHVVVTRAFAFRISSEREFVGFMGVNERKERDARENRTPTEKVN